MKRNILIFQLSLIILITTAQAEAVKDSCMLHTWKGTIGNTSIFMEFDDYLGSSHYHGSYYALPNMEFYGLAGVTNQSINKEGLISDRQANENPVDTWQEGTNIMDPKLGHETYAYTGTLIMHCSGNTMTGQRVSLDGKNLLPLQAEIAKASFDCKIARSTIEKLVCGDQKLSALDSKLDGFYKADLTKYSTDEAGDLKEDQINWMRNVRRICDDISCLKQIYEYRIFELSQNNHFRKFKIPSIRLDGINVNTMAHSAFRIIDSNQRNKYFNYKIKRNNIGGEITECNILIDIGVGVANGNNSYGGVCTLTRNWQKSNVMICDDEMVGHFKMENIDHEVSKQELVNFIVSNCYGG